MEYSSAAKKIIKKKNNKEKSRKWPAAGRRNRALIEGKALFRMTLILTVLLTLFSCFVVSVYAQATAFEYEKAEIKKEIEKQRALSQELEVEIARLSSSERIKEIASNKLGMKKPEFFTYIFLSKKSERGKELVAKSTQVPLSNSDVNGNLR